MRPAASPVRMEATMPADYDAPFFNNPFQAPPPDPDPETLTPADEPDVKPASMAMRKAELLARLHDIEDEQTKAELLERIKELDGTAEAEAPQAAPLMASQMPVPELRSVTIDGVSYSWTEATEDAVPALAREVWAQSKAAGG